MTRYAVQLAEGMWNGLVAGLRRLGDDPWAVAVLVGAGLLLWQLAGR